MQRPIHPSWYVTCVWVVIHGDPSTRHGMLHVCELSSMETHPPVMVCYMCVSCHPWRPIHPSWYVRCVWVAIHWDPSTCHGTLRVCELSSMETHPPVMVCYVCVNYHPWRPPVMVCYVCVNYHPCRPIHPPWYVTCVSYHPCRPIHPSWYVTCVSYHPCRPIHPSWYVTCVWVVIHGDPPTRHGMLRVCELPSM